MSESPTEVRVQEVSLRCVAVRPGDVIVFSSEKIMTQAHVDALVKHVKDVFPDNECIMLVGAVSIGVMSHQEAENIKKCHKIVVGTKELCSHCSRRWEPIEIDDGPLRCPCCGALVGVDKEVERMKDECPR